MGSTVASGRVLDLRSRLTSFTVLCPRARPINPCLVLVQPRKTLPHTIQITEKLLTGMFVWFHSLHPSQQFFSYVVRVLVGWTNTKQGLMCLAQGHKTLTPVRLQSEVAWSWVKHSTGFAQAWKVLEFRDISWNVLENLIYLEKYRKNHSKALKSPWILLFSVGLGTVDRDLNQYKIAVPLFGAAYAAPNRGTTVFLLILQY